MTTQKQALEAALSALESERIMAKDDQGDYTVEVTPKRIIDAIEKVKAALAEPGQEPVAYRAHINGITYFASNRKGICLAALGADDDGLIESLYTSPQPTQPREWQELSEDEVLDIVLALKPGLASMFASTACKAISAALRAKNGGTA
jgi:hypothetical protein